MPPPQWSQDFLLSAAFLSHSQPGLIHTLSFILIGSRDAAAQQVDAENSHRSERQCRFLTRSALVRTLMRCSLMENVFAASNCSAPPPCHTKRRRKISAEAPEEQQESRRVKPSTRKVERRKVAGGDSEARAEESTPTLQQPCSKHTHILCMYSTTQTIRIS